MERVKTDLRPEQILENPLLNKGTAFTNEEREALGLHGLIPVHVSTIEEQTARRYANFQEKPSQLSKYQFLSSLQNRNEILFYRLVYEHVSEMLPLIYTPTVGDVSLQYSSLYRQHRGLYLSYPLKDKMEEIIADLPHPHVEVIVVTDGERILGLGDVGIGGMAIPQGKLSLYTLFGGIHPARTLPILLDVGTNNQELLNDPLYLGWKHPRITGVEYAQFVDGFVRAIKKRYPRVLLQWEDFAKPNARPLLERYRDEICSFNDDIQGTAAVALAALLSALKLSKRSLKTQKIALLGGGSAGLGIADLIRQAMVNEGLEEKASYHNFYVVDIHGLLHDQLQTMDPEQKKFAHPFSEVGHWASGSSQMISLTDVIKHAQPTILIGVSAQPNTFTQEMIKTMASYCEHPIIFPLSNPTSRAEAKPADLFQWSGGKAIVATGSPFTPVSFQGKEYKIAQCNNVYIFPGVGLGIVACKTPKVTERMFIEAANVLSLHSPLLNDATAGLFPPLEKLRSVSKEIAIAVYQVAIEEGLVAHTSQADIEKKIDAEMWYPDYPAVCRA